MKFFIFFGLRFKVKDLGQLVFATHRGSAHAKNSSSHTRPTSFVFLHMYIPAFVQLCQQYMVGGGQRFQLLPKSLPSNIRGRNDAWGPIPPPDWRTREVTKQLGRNRLGVWEVLGSDKPEPICSFSGFASFWVLCVHACLCLDTARVPAHRRCAWGCCASFCKDRYVFGGASACARWAGV